jgi:polyhydroxyalkanoate synthesis regulator phasin
MEECEVDHYSSMLYSEMMGYDLADSRVHDQIVHETLWYPMSDEGRIERIREAAREKIEALEKRVAELESELDRTK